MSGGVVVFTGIKIDCAENGLEACAKFAADPEKYDLRRLEKVRSTPIAAMSANSFAEDIEAGLQAGMGGHLFKPVNQKLLLETLAAMLLARV